MLLVPMLKHSPLGYIYLSRWGDHFMVVRTPDVINVNSGELIFPLSTMYSREYFMIHSYAFTPLTNPERTMIITHSYLRRPPSITYLGGRPCDT